MNQATFPTPTTMNAFFRSAALVLATSTIIPLASYAQAAPKLTDPEIAHIAVTANQIDIGYAKIAMQRSKNPDVLKFAQSMIDDHTAVINQATALVKKLNVTPANNAESKKLLADADKTKKQLESKSKGAFDKAYIDNEVAYHTAVIGAVENTLIPSAQNPELKKLLESAVPLFKTHLAHAQMLQKQFASK